MAVVKKSAAKKTPVKAKAAVKPAAKKSAAKSGIDFTAEMIKKAKAYQKSLVLPEGDEERTIKAAAKIVAKNIAKKVILLGSREKIESAAQALKVSLAGIDIIDPATSPWLDDFGKTYFELRQGKINKKTNLPEVSDAAAGKAYMLSDYLSFGAMMVRKGYADAMVSGARSSTAALLRAGLKVIGTESKTASSCFVMDMHDPAWGYKGLMIFSDCAVVPEPDAEQLSDIAVAAGKSCKALLGCDPCIALLSFSTKGSGGAQPSVLTVQEAVQKHEALARNVSWHLIGHLQTNKVKQAVKLFDFIHSVDSEHLLLAVDEAAQKIHKAQDILLQVNLAREESKFGIYKENLPFLLQKADSLPHVRLRGLMCIAPNYEDVERCRPLFREMYDIFEELKALPLKNSEMRWLSMGMTHDYPIAVEEGANLVRVGTAIFGPRQY